MKNPKSSSSSSNITSLYFTVYPQSLSFQVPPSNDFILYLQKNLQILARFPTDGHFTAKQNIHYFNFPEKAISFRIFSDKNLAYQWSLYQTKNHEYKSHEEFVQSIKFDLAQFWNNLNTKKERFKQQQIGFNKKKYRLSFLIAAGSQKQIIQIIQQPFLKRIQANKSVNFPEFTLLQSQQYYPKQNSANAQKKNGDYKEKNQTRADAIQRQAVMNGNSQEAVESSQSQIILPKTASYQLLPKKQAVSLSPFYFQSPTKSYSPDKKNESLGVDSMLNSQLKIHLPLQQLEISNEIQKKIKDAEQALVNLFDRSQGVQNINSGSLHEDLMSKYRNQKRKRITQSQILTHNGQIQVTPFYKHSKYYFIIIAIIAIFLGLISVDPQSHTHHRHVQHVFKTKKVKDRNAIHKHKRKGNK